MLLKLNDYSDRFYFLHHICSIACYMPQSTVGKLIGVSAHCIRYSLPLLVQLSMLSDGGVAMKKWQGAICGSIYDEVLGWPIKA